VTDTSSLKVVLFCGGKGLRIRDYDEPVPKPMVPIGYRPIMWHIMRYYAHFGHRRFVLCLGHRADSIKEYFLRYNEALSNDFVLRAGGNHIELMSTDIHDWEIAFVDTGLESNIGERLRAVRSHVQDEEVFLANYGDGLTDAPLDELVADFLGRDKVGAFISVRAPLSYDFVQTRDDGLVADIRTALESDFWINGGFFMFRREIFDYIGDGEDLVREPFRRLIERDLLIAYRYEGFFAPMDTLKDHQELDALFNSGSPPWALWQRAGGGGNGRVVQSLQLRR
jgi:glucose-1-phosphate cytidylyltransferase